MSTEQNEINNYFLWKKQTKKQSIESDKPWKKIPWETFEINQLNVNPDVSSHVLMNINEQAAELRVVIKNFLFRKHLTVKVLLQSVDQQKMKVLILNVFHFLISPVKTPNMIWFQFVAFLCLVFL